MRRIRLSFEKELVLLLSRVTFTDSDLVLIQNIIKQEVNWVDFLSYALINKTVGLIYSNMKKYKLFPKRIKPAVLLSMRSFYYAMQDRNKELLDHADQVCQAMQEHGVTIIPLKGIQLLREVYIDYGSRSLNDLDFLCNYIDLKKIMTVMQTIGYVEGEYDLNRETILDFSREKKLLWKTKMNNIPTFCKKSANRNVEVVEVDFSFSLDLRRQYRAVDYIFADVDKKEFSIYDFLLHLCSHLFKEAEGDLWIAAAADLNLIKFCDIREFYICNQNEIQMEKLINRSIELMCSDALFYCVYYLNYLYDDQFIADLLNEMENRELVLAKTRLSYFDYSTEDEYRFFQRLFTYKSVENLSDKNYEYKSSVLEGMK